MNDELQPARHLGSAFRISHSAFIIGGARL